MSVENLNFSYLFLHNNSATWRKTVADIFALFILQPSHIPGLPSGVESVKSRLFIHSSRACVTDRHTENDINRGAWIRITR